jgi:hypothetical protein
MARFGQLTKDSLVKGPITIIPPPKVVTITVLRYGKQVIIMLYGIDTAEKGVGMKEGGEAVYFRNGFRKEVLVENMAGLPCERGLPRSKCIKPGTLR